jgi:hypothetical protein
MTLDTKQHARIALCFDVALKSNGVGNEMIPERKPEIMCVFKALHGLCASANSTEHGARYYWNRR